MTQKIEISPKTILFITSLLIVGWLLLVIRDIIFLLFISFIIMSAIRPLVEYLEKVKLPRSLAIITVYIFLISLIIIYSSFIFPPLVAESVKLLQHLPQYFSQLSPYIKYNPETLFQQIAPIGQNVAKVTLGVFTNILSLVTILVFTFYFLLERNNLSYFLEFFVGSGWSKRIVNIINNSELRMGAWVRGQFILMIIIGQASYIGLTLLGVNYALPLALIAGTLEAFPIIGPNLSAIPAILIALLTSPGLALAVAALYFIIQQLENNLIVPTVMKKTVGIPPLVSLIILMIGGKIGGVVGVILAIPTFLVIQTISKELLQKK